MFLLFNYKSVLLTLNNSYIDMEDIKRLQIPSQIYFKKLNTIIQFAVMTALIF